MAYQFTTPERTVIGENALPESEAYIKGFGSKAFIVTGKHITKSGILKQLTDLLEAWGTDYEVFNDITGEPTDEMISAGVGVYKEAECDFIIAIGGGSPIDSAKAIAAMSVLEGEIASYMGAEIKGDFPPMVLIPTTAGTGSEATKFTIITDTKKDVKMLLKGESLLPELAIIDSKLTITAPKSITASTGMDALTHAVESYISKRSNDLTDMYALDAIKRIFSYLPQAYKDGTDEKARYEMAIASYEAGVCINNASVTLVHGMSRPIGALFHVPHGISNAMLIKECLEYVADGCTEKFADIAKAIGAAKDDDDDAQAAKRFIQSLVSLMAELNIPTLNEYGIDRSKFDAYTDKMATDAMASGSPLNTITEVGKEDLVKIYKNLW